MNQRLIEAVQAIRQYVENSEQEDAIQGIACMFAELLADIETLRASGYSIDSDPHGIRARTVDAVVGALAFGAQDTNPPPAGHWLEPIWNIARAERHEAETLRARVAGLNADPEHENLPEGVCEAVAQTLGGSYDCVREWSAWQIGTMTEDDFWPIANDKSRVREIAMAAISAWGRYKRGR